jgi:hypothetical protein
MRKGNNRKRVGLKCLTGKTIKSRKNPCGNELIQTNRRTRGMVNEGGNENPFMHPRPNHKATSKCMFICGNHREMFWG